MNIVHGDVTTSMDEVSISRAPPSGWTRYVNDDGIPFYANDHTGETVWARDEILGDSKPQPMVLVLEEVEENEVEDTDEEREAYGATVDEETESLTDAVRRAAPVSVAAAGGHPSSSVDDLTQHPQGRVSHLAAGRSSVDEFDSKWQERGSVVSTASGSASLLAKEHRSAEHHAFLFCMYAVIAAVIPLALLWSRGMFDATDEGSSVNARIKILGMFVFHLISTVGTFSGFIRPVGKGVVNYMLVLTVGMAVLQVTMYAERPDTAQLEVLDESKFSPPVHGRCEWVSPVSACPGGYWGVDTFKLAGTENTCAAPGHAAPIWSLWQQYTQDELLDILSAIVATLPVLTTLEVNVNGVDVEGVDQDACVNAIIQEACLTMRPKCSAQCVPVMPCFSECARTRQICKGYVSQALLERLLPGGRLRESVTAILGTNLALLDAVVGGLMDCAVTTSSGPVPMLQCKQEQASQEVCRDERTQSDYVGTRNSTLSGIPCQPWQVQTPHQHTRGLHLEHNYCRNAELKAQTTAGARGCAWCYTEDPQIRTECCDVKCQQAASKMVVFDNSSTSTGVPPEELTCGTSWENTPPTAGPGFDTLPTFNRSDSACKAPANLTLLAEARAKELAKLQQNYDADVSVSRRWAQAEAVCSTALVVLAILLPWVLWATELAWPSPSESTVAVQVQRTGGKRGSQSTQTSRSVSRGRGARTVHVDQFPSLLDWWRLMGWPTFLASCMLAAMAMLCLVIGHAHTGGLVYTIIFNLTGIVIISYAIRWPVLYHHFLPSLFGLTVVGALAAESADIATTANKAGGQQKETSVAASLCGKCTLSVRTAWKHWRLLFGIRGKHFFKVTLFFEVGELAIQLLNISSAAYAVNSWFIVVHATAMSVNLIATPILWICLRGYMYRREAILLFDSSMDIFYIAFSVIARGVGEMDWIYAIVLLVPIFVLLNRTISVSTTVVLARGALFLLHSGIPVPVSALEDAGIKDYLRATGQSMNQQGSSIELAEVVAVPADGTAGWKARSSVSPTVAPADDMFLGGGRIDPEPSVSRALQRARRLSLAEISVRARQNQPHRHREASQAERNQQEETQIQGQSSPDAAVAAVSEAVSSTSLKHRCQLLGAVLCSLLGLAFFLFVLLSVVSQEQECTRLVGPAVMERVTDFVYFPNGIFAAPRCNFLRSTQSLNLQRAGLTEVPTGLPLFTDLRVLDLSENAIRSLPVLLARITSLQRLVARNNLISSSATFVALLRAWDQQPLTALDLEGNPVLELLDLSGLSLLSLPPIVSLFAHQLQGVDVSRNAITEFPAVFNVNVSSRLQWLDLSANQLTGVPEGLELSNSMRFLNLSHNSLSEVRNEQSLAVWNRVSNTIDVSYNQIDRLGAIGVSGQVVYVMGNPVRNLYWARLLLDEVPLYVSQLTELEVLDIGDNKIKELPVALETSNTALTTVILDGNKIPLTEATCRSMSHVQHIRWVRGLKEMTSHVGLLTQLQGWELLIKTDSQNSPFVIPEELAQLPNLRKFYLSPAGSGVNVTVALPVITSTDFSRLRWLSLENVVFSTVEEAERLKQLMAQSNVSVRFSNYDTVDKMDAALKSSLSDQCNSAIRDGFRGDGVRSERTACNVRCHGAPGGNMSSPALYASEDANGTLSTSCSYELMNVCEWVIMPPSPNHSVTVSLEFSNFDFQSDNTDGDDRSPWFITFSVGGKRTIGAEISGTAGPLLERRYCSSCDYYMDWLLHRNTGQAPVYAPAGQNITVSFGGNTVFSTSPHCLDNQLNSVVRLSYWTTPVTHECLVTTEAWGHDNWGWRQVSCPAGCAPRGGAVYGTGPFSAASAICPSAIYAGLVSRDAGGFVNVSWAPGQDLYLRPGDNNWPEFFSQVPGFDSIVGNRKATIEEVTPLRGGPSSSSFVLSAVAS